MTIATANRSQVYGVPETAWGTARPAVSGTGFAVTFADSAYTLTDSNNGLTEESFPVGGTFVATGFTNGTIAGVITSRTSAGSIAFTKTTADDFATEPAGDTVTITPTARPIRTTDGGINLTVNTIRSSELRADRMISDLIRAGYGAEGSINGELSANNWDEFISSAMYNDWGAAPAAVAEASTFAITVTAGVYKLTDSGNKLVIASLPVGGMFRATGFTQGTVIGVVTERTSDGDITFSPLNTVIAEAAGDAVTVTPMSVIKNGVTENSLTLYQNFADAGIWRTTPGFIVSPFGMTIEADNLATVAAGGQARDAIYSTDAPDQIPSDDAAAPSYTDPVIAAADVLDVVFDGNPAAKIFFQSIEITIENNLRSRKALSTIENLAVVAGEADISGTATAYFENADLYTHYRAGTPYTVGISIQDTQGKGYAIYIPRAKTAESEQTPGGSNEDIFDELTWTATRHADFNAYMLIGRF